MAKVTESVCTDCYKRKTGYCTDYTNNKVWCGHKNTGRQSYIDNDYDPDVLDTLVESDYY